MKEPTIGRSFDEGDGLYVAVSESDAQTLYSKYESVLSRDDLEVLKELVEVMRKTDPGWGSFAVPV